MSNPRIEVEIGANVDKLRRAVDGSLVTLQELTKESKELQKALENATDVDSIAQYNRQLKETQAAIQALKNVGTTGLGGLGGAAGAAGEGVDKLTRSTQQYNSVGIDFARIIQDAPFGIIGVGNNITQLAGSFQQLRNSSTSTGAALKTALSSIIAPTNLLVLGISALTTALTLYSQGAFGAKKEVESLDQAQKDFNDTLKETDKLVRAEFYTQILRDLGILEIQVTDTGKVIKDVFSDKTAEERLQLLSNRIKTATKPELEALAKFLQENLQGAFRSAANSSSELERQIAQADIKTYKQQLELVNGQLSFYKVETDKATKSTKDLKTEIFTFSTNPLVDAYFEAIRVGAQFETSINRVASALKGNEGEKAFGLGFSIKDLNIDTSSFTPFEGIPDELITKIQSDNELLISSFSALGNQVAQSFNISNNALRGFVSTLLSNAPKIIQAIIAQSRAKKAAANLNSQANAQEAASEGIAVASKAANALGPVGLALLPVFIGGALALISGAFKKTGSSGIGSVGTSGISGGSSFTGTGGQAFNSAQNINLVGQFRVSGTDLVYVIDRTKESQI